MNKRCSAKNCFNSTFSNKSVTYHSFPKNEKFSKQWAKAAEREDLFQKPLSRIVKYYLCSEHFAANCFEDKQSSSPKILKRNLPYSIALPTIFRNNLQDNLQTTNSKQSIEIYNFIVMNKKNNLLFKNEPLDKICHDRFNSESISFPNYFKKQKIAYSKELMLLNFNDPMDIMVRCRFCANTNNSKKKFTPFSKIDIVKQFVLRIMPDKISEGDNKSQMVCNECIDKTIYCMEVVQDVEDAQKYFHQIEP